MFRRWSDHTPNQATFEMEAILYSKSPKQSVDIFMNGTMLWEYAHPRNSMKDVEE